MKTEKSPSKRLKPWLAWAAAIVLIASVVIILIPHRTQTIEVYSLLQSGKKMNVRITLQSMWGWQLPDRLAAMSVSLDGENLPMPKDAFMGLGPVDLARHPAIGERIGFPEITVFGKPKSHFDWVKWMFLNNSYSERHLMQNHQTEITYHAEPPSAPGSFTGKPGVPDKYGVVAVNLDGGMAHPLTIKKVSK